MLRLQFSRSTELVSKLIAKACRSPFSHVDLVLPDNTLLGASNSPKVPVLAGASDGVAIRDFNYQPFALRRQALITCSAKVERNFIDKAMSQLGEPFDSTSMHAVFNEDFAIDRDWRDESAWFCSELKTWCGEEAGLWPYQILVAKKRVTPSDLLLLLNPLMINVDTFFDPIPGLVLGPMEY